MDRTGAHSIFNAEKEAILRRLGKTDRSKKGSVDQEIKGIIDTFNKCPEFYTTSSCAGRILCLETGFPIQKEKVNWLFVTHDIVDLDSTADRLIQVIKSAEMSSSDLWFKQEPPILHVCSRTLEDATRLVHRSHESGLKHSGIISISNSGRIIVGIVTAELIETPLRIDGDLIVPEDYIRTLVHLGGKKLAHARKKVSRLHQMIKENDR